MKKNLSPLLNLKVHSLTKKKSLIVMSSVEKLSTITKLDNPQLYEMLKIAQLHFLR